MIYGYLLSFPQNRTCGSVSSSGATVVCTSAKLSSQTTWRARMRAKWNYQCWVGQQRRKHYQILQSSKLGKLGSLHDFNDKKLHSLNEFSLLNEQQPIHISIGNNTGNKASLCPSQFLISCPGSVPSPKFTVQTDCWIHGSLFGCKHQIDCVQNMR